jgi:hypothetical protein
VRQLATRLQDKIESTACMHFAVLAPCTRVPLHPLPISWPTRTHARPLPNGKVS